MYPWKIEISPLSSCRKKIQWGRKARQLLGEGKMHTVSFEPVSPCWVEFDIQTMRQGSTQGGQPPCNINSHLESSCGYEHETLKETAAMDPVPSHHLLHCLLKRLPYCFLKPKWGENTNSLLFLMKFPFWLQSLGDFLCLCEDSVEMSPACVWGNCCQDFFVQKTRCFVCSKGKSHGWTKSKTKQEDVCETLRLQNVLKLREEALHWNGTT